ncbi:hypothetical protein Plhal304r1_c033g0105511 [Plasmopara halstedii]
MSFDGCALLGLAPEEKLSSLYLMGISIIKNIICDSCKQLIVVEIISRRADKR